MSWSTDCGATEGVCVARTPPERRDDRYVQSYLLIRTVVGFLGFLLWSFPVSWLFKGKTIRELVPVWRAPGQTGVSAAVGSTTA